MIMLVLIIILGIFVVIHAITSISTTNALTNTIAKYKDQLEYGQTYSASNSFKGLNTDLNYFKSADYIDEVVNSAIDYEKESLSQKYNMPKKESAYLTNIINSYRVSPSIVGIQVTFFLLNKDTSVITVYHKCYNFDLMEKNQMYLTDIFDSRAFSNELRDIDTSNVLFRNKDFVCFSGKDETTYPYSLLINYNCTVLLTPENYGLSNSEYYKLFGE